MTNKEKARLSMVYNDLITLQRDFSKKLPYGGQVKLNNSIYTIGTHITDVPEKDGLKDYDFIYKHDN